MNKLTTPLKFIVNRLFILAYALDQAGSAILFLKPDHTISGEIGYAKFKGKWWGKLLAPVINGLFFWQEDHCYWSIEWDEADKPPFRIWH